MKRIFRSIIDIRKDNRPTIEPDDLVRNYRSFLSSKIKPEDPSHTTLYHWLESHYREHKELPSVNLLEAKAIKEGNEGVIVALRDIITEIPYTRSNFKEILKQKFEEQARSEYQKVLNEAWQAANDGLKIGKNKEIKGLGQSIEYFISKARDFRMVDVTVKTESNIKTIQDGTEVVEQYKLRKKDPLANLGMYTFLSPIDNPVRGLNPGELMLVAAYVKQGKTIMVTNLAYSGIVQGLNGLFITLEMNFQEMRDMIYVMHTINPDWIEHKKYSRLVGKVTYDKVRHGELEDQEQEFFEVVSNDFVSKKNMGDLFIYQPTESLTFSRLEMIVYDYNARLREMGKQLDFLIIDYVGLMYPDRDDKYGDYNIDLNNIIKKLKNLSINFDNGRMLRTISPFQINRQGHKDAEKNDGLYKLSALSNANEAERSSDLVITTYMTDEMKKAGTIKIACLACRRGPGFDPFEARIDFGTRHITEFIQQRKTKADEENTIREIPVDV
jgi:replicative DNA helicase